MYSRLFYKLTFHRKGKDDGDVAMNENAAYGPITATQQPQDHIYAQPSNIDEM